MHCDFSHLWPDHARMGHDLHKPAELLVGIPVWIGLLVLKEAICDVVDEEIRKVEGVRNVLTMLLISFRVAIHEFAEGRFTGVRILLPKPLQPLVFFANNSYQNERILVD